jgi:hypothetical protein
MSKHLGIALLVLGAIFVGALAAQGAEQAPTKAPAVLLCGTGPSPHFETIVNGLSDSLADRSVKTSVADGHDFSRSSCLTKANDTGAVSLLYIVADISEKDRSIVTATCLAPDGRKLWSEEAKGPWLTTSVNATVRNVSEQLVKKIGRHVGSEGLPTK